MSKVRFTLNILAVVIFTLTVASMAQAQATRTWVSGVGDDANPCSRTAPCKTFAGAISKTAAKGEISVLDPGGFGAVTITKSITINGDGTLAGILSAGTTGVIVNAPGLTDVVYLRSISINGGGTGVNGIRFLGNGKLYVENCTITGISSAAPNGNGIFVDQTATGRNLFVTNTSIRSVSNNGISVKTTTGFVAAVLDGVNIEGSPTGVLIGDNAFVTIRNANISLTTVAGVSINGLGSATGSLEGCLINNNPIGISVGNANFMNLSSSALENNTTGVSSGAPQINLRSSGNNRFLGNTNDGANLTVIVQK